MELVSKIESLRRRAFSVYEELLLLPSTYHGDLAAAWDGGSVGRRPGPPARASLRGVFGGHVPAGAHAPPVLPARGGEEEF